MLSRTLVFCFPYHAVGGVSVLFLRLAEELGRCGVVTAIVDYPQGYMARRHDPSLTRLIEYGDNDGVELPDDAILILQAMTPWSIFPGLKISPSTNVFFWNCHPFNLVPTLPGLRRRMQSNASFGAIVLGTLLRSYRTLMRRFIKVLMECDALVFMDRTNVSTTETYLGIKVPAPEMLAIPAPSASQQQHALPELECKGLRLAWIGRLVDFKYYPLLNTLNQLDVIQPKLGLPITMSVIGGGAYEVLLRDHVKSLRHVSVRFHGELESVAMQRHLERETDVLFAMGTSALEGARLGVPTMLLDLSYSEVPIGYRFSWLHERDGYSLADVAHGDHDGEAGAASLSCRLMRVVEAPMEISAESKSYFRLHHEIDTIAAKLVFLANRSRCTYGDLVANSLVGRGFLYKIFRAVRKGVSAR